MAGADGRCGLFPPFPAFLFSPQPPSLPRRLSHTQLAAALPKCRCARLSAAKRRITRALRFDCSTLTDSTPNGYPPAEIESLDYESVDNAVHRSEVARRTRVTRYAYASSKWLICFLIGE